MFDRLISYTFHGKAHKWNTAKSAISMQRSIDGMPILISGNAILLDALMAPEDVRKDMRI